MSSVFFKFTSQKEPTRVEFDGTGISVFELKREIINKVGLGDGTDFDLSIYDEGGKDEYKDDTTIIPRATVVVARRFPASKPGAGRAARYVSGKMPTQARIARKEQTAKDAEKARAAIANADTEEEKWKAMFDAEKGSWTANREELASEKAIFHGRPGHRPANAPDHDPPNGYICYRCGEKGHWIQLCPTNDDPEFNNRRRVKRTTGIPRSFLSTVDKDEVLAANAGDGETKRTPGLMVNADGDFVIARTDKNAWEKFQAKAAKTDQDAADGASNDGGELASRGLECPMDKKLFIDPLKTPCCGKTYCSNCITDALIESDFVCPACKTEGVLLDDLVADPEVNDKIKEYLEEKEAAKKAVPVADGADDEAEATTAEAKSDEKDQSPRSPSSKEKSPSAAAERTHIARSSASPRPNSNSPTPTSVPVGPPKDFGANEQASAGNDKKRPAEDAMGGPPKIPKGPKAMQQQQEAQDMQGNMMGNMMGLPNMGMMNPMMNPMMGMGGMPMPNMMNMGMMNPMMNPMMAMNGMGMPNMFGGGPGGGANGGQMGAGMNNMNGGGMNGNGMGGAYNGSNGGGGPHMNGRYNNGYGGPRNQYYQGQGGGGPANEEAYFRKPVNPHRHQNRQRRVRPSDYRELG